MHAYLIFGKTEKERLEASKSLFSQKGIRQIHKIEPKKDIHTIWSIRNLIHMLKTSALNRKQGRGILIVQADKLTKEAANAFLKTLEEPNDRTVFVLTAPSRESVLETISSRCELRNLGNYSLEIDKDTIREAEESFRKLSEIGLGERLATVEQLGDREQALKFVKCQICAGRNLMLARVRKGKNVQEIARIIELLEQTRQDLETNVNVKLAIGNLLIHWGKN